MSMIYNWFQHVSIFGLFVLTFFVTFIAFELGVILGKRHRDVAEDEDKSPINSIVAATLGLLAFLLAFTFGMAAQKFDERRSMVVDEANAVGTTYLRAEYLPESQRVVVRKLLKEYVATRLDTIRLGNLEEGIKRSDIIQDKLWEQAVELAKEAPNSIVVGLFIQSLNEVIDLHAKRLNVGVHIRIPMIIWVALYFVTVLAVGSLGYQIGLLHTRYMGISSLLILTFSAVIILIIDLDRPQEGFMKVSQQSLTDLIDKFNKSP